MRPGPYNSARATSRPVQLGPYNLQDRTTRSGGVWAYPSRKASSCSSRIRRSMSRCSLLPAARTIATAVTSQLLLLSFPVSYSCVRYFRARNSHAFATRDRQRGPPAEALQPLTTAAINGDV
eukprot:2577944-Rhodomonas_salina.2